MSDLISRKRIEYELCESNMPKKYREFCRRVINSESLSPSVDAVEVVRCKNCEYCLPYDSKKYCSHYPYRECYVVVDKNDFCSYAKRKGGE